MAVTTIDNLEDEFLPVNQQVLSENTQETKDIFVDSQLINSTVLGKRKNHSEDAETGVTLEN